eukprot:scaffold6000_cov184-Isochrysis_galbana.AAC.1
MVCTRRLSVVSSVPSSRNDGAALGRDGARPSAAGAAACRFLTAAARVLRRERVCSQPRQGSVTETPKRSLAGSCPMFCCPSSKKELKSTPLTRSSPPATRATTAAAAPAMAAGVSWPAP